MLSVRPDMVPGTYEEGIGQSAQSLKDISVGKPERIYKWNIEAQPLIPHRSLKGQQYRYQAWLPEARRATPYFVTTLSQMLLVVAKNIFNIFVSCTCLSHHETFRQFKGNSVEISIEFFHETFFTYWNLKESHVKGNLGMIKQRTC